MPKVDGSGRKRTNLLELFPDIDNSNFKVPRGKCIFCTKEVPKTGAKMKFHLEKCRKVHDSIKNKYLQSSTSTSANSTLDSEIYLEELLIGMIHEISN